MSTRPSCLSYPRINETRWRLLSADESPKIQYSLPLITHRRRGYILNFSQAPDGEPSDLNHSESEFVSQTVNETEVGVSEPNGSGLEFVIRHRCYFYNTTNRRVVAEEQ
jgi:hypothetical protein